MRIIRLGALFGSLMLLVATSLALINRRSELENEQDRRVIAAATIARNSVETTLLRARAVAQLATANTVPTDLLETFEESASACVITTTTPTCSQADLTALDSFGPAAALSAAAGGDAVSVVDSLSESVLVVARSEVTVIIRLPIENAVVGPIARESIAAEEVDLVAEPVEQRGPSVVGQITSENGRRVIESTLVDPFADGAILVTVSVADDVGLGADSPVRYGVLLGLGTVLLALAAWTFLVERRQLERRATTDALTGLVNRSEFERQSEEAIDMAGRFGTGLCIMLMDLNGFKQINDTLGHQVGDDVLKICADRLRIAVRDTDLVGRWGGDEFVVLLPGLEDATAVRNSAERIGASLGMSPVTGDVGITGSIGAALYPRHGRSLEELIQAADIAMYEAKTTGVVHRLASTIADDRVRPSPGYYGPERRATKPGHEDGSDEGDHAGLSDADHERRREIEGEFGRQHDRSDGREPVADSIHPRTPTSRR